MWHNINLNRPFWQKHFLPLNCSAFGIIMIMENLISQSVGWGEVRDEGWGWWWLDMINWHGMTPGAVIGRQGTPLSRGHCPWCCDIIWHVRGTLHTPDTGWLKWSSSVHHSIHSSDSHKFSALSQHLKSKSWFSCRGPVIFMTHPELDPIERSSIHW